MASAARTEAACLARTAPVSLPLREAFDRWATANEAFRAVDGGFVITAKPRLWDDLNRAEFEARADLLAELGLHGLDRARLKLLGDVL